MTTAEKRQHVRFSIIKDIATPVDLLFGSLTTPVPGILLDLSCGGMGLLTFIPIEIGTKITANIELPGLKINSVEGRVLWTLTKGNSWRLGIAFTKIEKSDFENIKKVAEDYQNCETKLIEGTTDHCKSNCFFRAMCSKPVKSNAK